MAEDIRAAGVHDRAQATALRILEESRGTSASSPEIANRILREIRLLSRVEDPYTLFKSREMERAEMVFRQIQDRVGEDLRSRVSVAALGNSLDFFEDPESVLGEIPERLGHGGICFFHDHVARLEELLAGKPGLVLYLTDNAGEIYFDVPLYEYLRAHSDRVVLVVKGGPGLNDLTRHELESHQLVSCFAEVADTGTDGVGIEWSRTSRQFRELVDSADLILSKGMANFETVYPREIAPATLFIFKVKCLPIENYIGAPIGSFIALCQAPGRDPQE